MITNYPSPADLQQFYAWGVYDKNDLNWYASLGYLTAQQADNIFAGRDYDDNQF